MRKDSSPLHKRLYLHISWIIENPCPFRKTQNSLLGLGAVMKQYRCHLTVVTRKLIFFIISKCFKNVGTKRSMLYFLVLEACLKWNMIQCAHQPRFFQRNWIKGAVDALSV